MNIWKSYMSTFLFVSLLLIPAGHLASAAGTELIHGNDVYVLTVHKLNEGLSKSQNFAQKGFTLIDVRTIDEHRTGFIPGTDLNIDFREIGVRHQEIGANLDDHIVVYCQSGHRSNIAAETLAGIGYKYVYNVAGSMNAWTEAGYPVQNIRR